MAKLQLRDYQTKMVQDVSQAFREGHKRILLSGPTGMGKTEIAVSMLNETKNNGKRGLFVADRIALCDQASERLEKYDIPHGVFQGSGHPKYAPSANIQIGSVQTLIRRKTEPFQLHIYDEAHQLYAWSKRQLECGTGYHVGLSASGFTKNLGNYFDCIVNGPTTNQMIEQGWLVPLKIYSCREPDMSNVPVGNDGEWEEKAAESEVMQIVGDVVQNYIEHGNDQKFICFAQTIAHAKELQGRFLACGINVQTYTADDDGGDKADIVEEFRKDDSAVRGLISVAALVKGFDVSSVRILIIARCLRKAFADHVQMLGRVMRTYYGKEFGIVFDHAGNCARFWFRTTRFFEHGLEKLNKGEKEETEESAKEKQEKPEPEPIKCPSCGHLAKPSPTCSQCGFEFPKRSEIPTVPGTLKELVATGNKFLMQQELWPQVVDYVLRKGHAGEVAQKKAAGIYKGLTGEWPSSTVSRTEPKECSAEVRGHIINRMIRFAKAKNKKK